MNQFNVWRTVFIVGAALGFGLCVILLTSQEPGVAVHAFFVGPFSNTYFFGNLLASAIPLVLTGVAACVSFSASVFNLGLEGQVYLGSFLGVFLAWRFETFPPIVLYPFVFSIVFCCSGLLAALSGYLKIKRNVNTLISSLLISYIAIYLVDALIETVFIDPNAGMAATPYFSDRFLFAKLLPPSDLHAGLFLALIFTFSLYLVMKKSVFGFEIALTGKNPTFARYTGISVSKILMLSMFLSGGFAGMAGMIDIFGIHGRMIRGFSNGYGWNGIAVALIARNQPLWAIPSALFFAYLENAANVGALLSDITPEIARTIQATIFFTVTAETLFSFVRKKKGGEAWKPSSTASSR
ncbi:MAG TPA: ABC transporter permease [Thermotogota bacterium]|nr:ABC transporter permease [Thermotogota bacterium]